MSATDRLGTACLMPGFAGPVVPDALGGALPGFCPYGQDLPADRSGDGPVRVAPPSAGARTAVGETLAGR
ncbi:hypothetical protein [Blastococcus sp. SYSU DS0619]